MASPASSGGRRSARSLGAPSEAIAPAWAQGGNTLTTTGGVPVDDTDNSLRVGERGPTLLDDFHLREKIMHFDHERIPERVVHARGAAAHGTFRLTTSIENLTCAPVLCDTSVDTPVFVRFSTVAGSRGSADTARDVRGFAVRFYTGEGNWDLVGNNMPVFFIQDGIKFPDLIHAAKPEPDREIPQAQTAHDTFWDFASLTPESTHMLMWIMSDRAIPRSFRTMEGFGVHTFRLVNADGETTLVKFHWKPVAGIGFPGVGGGPEARRHRPRLPPPRPVGRDRVRRRSRSGTSASRCSPTPTTRPSKASTCSTPPSWCPRSWPRCGSSVG